MDDFTNVIDAVDNAYDRLMAATDFRQAEERYEYLTTLIDSLALESDRMLASARVMRRVSEDEEAGEEEDDA